MIISVVLPALVSCKAISSLSNDGAVVARVGKNKLTLSEVRQYLPEGTTPEDSTKIVLQYINLWASEQIFSDIVENQLTKAEKDVSAELEEYRMSLLKYRYEQRYINERLDTSLTDKEIEDYYIEHTEDFVAEFPVVKARFMRITADSPNLELIKQRMSSKDIKDIMEADSLAYSSADKYTDYNSRWIDMVELAKDFGTDYGSLLSMMDKSFIQTKDEYGKINVAYISEYIKVGETLPLEFCTPAIKNILIGVRKNKLVSDLERNLLDDAREKGKFIIY